MSTETGKAARLGGAGADNPGAGAGSPTQSINLRVSGVFLFVLAAVVVLGLFSAWRLSDYRTYAGELRDRFFRSTQFIGDLNNSTSDFRAAEATAILDSDPVQAARNAADVRQLDALIALAQHSYEHVPHDAGERRLYAQFSADWADYRRIASQVIGAADTGRRDAATVGYMTVSRTAYDAASDALGRLTEQNLVDANVATRQADAAYQDARLATIAAIVFAAAMVVAGLLHMRRSVANPLVALARTMRALANNETDVEIPGADRRDEIGGMARAVAVFRQNAVDLALSQAALTERATLLAEQLAAEQRLTELQRNFLAMASHEFRTPLTIIDGHAQRLAREGERRDVADRAGKIRAAVQRITGVIERLIDAARLADSDEGLVFRPQDVDLAAVLGEVCQQYREIVPGARIREEYAPKALTVRGDRRLLGDLFGNLIANGIKYSVDAGDVRVCGADKDGEVVVRIEDRGVGIPEADRAHLFERYFRGANVSGIVGTGLGLYLVKMVADLHGGAVEVSSRVGQGSCFTVRLPGRPAAARREVGVTTPAPAA